VFRSNSAHIPLIFRSYSTFVSLALLWGIPQPCGDSIDNVTAAAIDPLQTVRRIP
jgi:hypothetical protein